MRRVVFGFALVAIVTARPELYREKEDFQYSRSSSDDGTKSGYYDAQRGNMGGNFERAHNMDSLAQHQMGGLIKQVGGELGDGSKTRSGSVYTAANSRGVFGSGHYDLSNLEGRNFQEGTTYSGSHSHSSANAYSSSQNNERSSSSQSQNSDYRRYSAGSQQETQNLYGTRQQEYGTQSGYDSRYNSQSGYQGSNLYEQSQADHKAAHNVNANTNKRLISTVPVKIIIRSGQRVAVPIATQTSGSHLASYYDHNAENSDAEVIATDGQQASFIPSNNAKHYESSYKYHKEWEKHDTNPEILPLSIPTVNPIPRNNELYDDSQLQYSHGSDNRYRQQSEFNAMSSNLRHQSDFNAQHQHRSSLSDSNSNAFSQSSHNADFNSNSANLVGGADSKPKSYQSSYSYHKSWERQGDPYVMKPAYEGKESQRLTDNINSQAQYDSRYATKSHQNYGSTGCIVECEPGHVRIARSYNTEPAQFEQQSQNLEDYAQQSQNQWDDLNNEGQQSQNTWEQTEYNAQEGQNKLEDFGQQSQNIWGQEGQQTQNKWDNLENLGQQSEQQWGNLENLGHQSRTAWSLPEAGQQTQTNTDNLEDFGQQNQKLEDFGQQSQSSSGHKDNGQQIENKWENLADLGQQSQSVWEQTEDSQQTQNKWDQFEQQTQDSHKNSEDFGQQSQTNWGQAEAGQQIQNQWDFGQSTNQENKKFEETQKSDQETQSIWTNVEKQESGVLHGLETQKHIEEQNFESNHMGGKQETQTSKNENFSFWDKIDGFEQKHTFQNEDLSLHGLNKTDDSTKNYGVDAQSTEQQPLGNLWDKITNLDGDFVMQDSLSNMDDDKFYSQSSSQSWHQEHSYQKSLNTEDRYENHGYQNHNRSDILNFNKVENFKENTNSSNIPNLEGHNEDMRKTYFDLPTATSTEKVNNDYNNFRPIDIGRGDIGPDDSEIDSSNSEDDKQKEHDINSPKEIDQDLKQEQSKNDVEENNIEKKVYNDKALINQPLDEAFEQQNVDQALIIQPQNATFERQNVDQQSLVVDNEKQEVDQQEVVNFEQQNMDHQSRVDFDKHTIGQQSLLNFEKQNIDQQSVVNFDQENMDQQSTEDFDHQYMDQQSLVDFDKQNMEQQFLVDKHNKDQKSLVDTENQQNQAEFQNVYSSTFNQHNLKDFGDFERQQESLNYHNQNFNKNSPFETFTPEEVHINKETSQDSQTYVESDVKQENEQSKTDNVIPATQDKSETQSPKILDKKENVASSTEAATEKPGFWKSVGSKFSSAKSKVASWFSS